MGHRKEREWLEALVSETDRAVRFFSNPKKPDRERSVCAAFLRCLGVDFSEQDIVSSQTQPPDVIFRDAHFEILEVLDEGRRRHDEWKAKYERRKRAKSPSDLLEPYQPPALLSYTDVIFRITKVLAKKSANYGRKGCANLDALVYVDLKNKSLNPNSPFQNPTKLIDQGWRSVSLIMPPYAHVLCTEHLAPAFLRNLVSQTKSEWTNLDELFELRDPQMEVVLSE